jgi:hypothetical protein
VPGVSEQPENTDAEYTVTEVSVTVLRRKQIEQYEPFEAAETITAEVTGDADLDAVTEELHDQAKEHVQRDIVKRVEEKQMKDELEG